MSKAPIMPLFTDALMGDTLHLSVEEFGAYLLILIATWRNNGVALADSETRMARICRVTTRRWRDRLRPALVQFFTLEDGRWHQKRLENEWMICAQRVAISRSNGARGGRPKSLKSNDTENPAGSLEQTRKKAIHIHIQNKKDSDSPDGESASIDPVKQLFDRGVKLLTNCGSRDPQARSIIGKWRKNYGDAAVMAAVVHCEDEGISDPVPYITRFLEHHRGNRNGRLTPANERFIAGREATLRAVLAAEERDRESDPGDKTGNRR